LELGVRLKPLLKPLPLPKALKAPIALLPDRLEKEEPYQEVYPAKGERRAWVGLLLGCAQRVLRPSINRAIIKVLQENGVEVLALKEQVCCGALNLHDGDEEGARALARRNLEAFRDVDYVITNAAGCGSGMKEYPLLFLGQPEEEAARRLAPKVKDLSVILDELGFLPPPPPRRPLKVAYHDACHLAHAQGVREAPRNLLRAAGLEPRGPGAQGVGALLRKCRHLQPLPAGPGRGPGPEEGGEPEGHRGRPGGNRQHRLPHPDPGLPGPPRPPHRRASGPPLRGKGAPGLSALGWGSTAK
jgi:hypothetical protein